MEEQAKLWNDDTKKYEIETKTMQEQHKKELEENAKFLQKQMELKNSNPLMSKHEYLLNKQILEKAQNI